MGDRLVGLLLDLEVKKKRDRTQTLESFHR